MSRAPRPPRTSPRDPSLSSKRWVTRGRSWPRGGNAGGGGEHARLRGVALLAGIFFVAGLAASVAFRGEGDAATTAASPGTTVKALRAAPRRLRRPREGGRRDGDHRGGRRHRHGARRLPAAQRAGEPLRAGERRAARRRRPRQPEQTLTDRARPSARRRAPTASRSGRPRTTPRRSRAREFTVLNLANNHSYDYGQTGMDDTVAALAARSSRTPGSSATHRASASAPCA